MKKKCLLCSGAVIVQALLRSVGAGVMVTSDFGRSVNPKTRGTDYAPTLLLTLLGSQSE